MIRIKILGCAEALVCALPNIGPDAKLLLRFGRLSHPTLFCRSAAILPM
jgi:hypothetical protein